MEEEPMAESSFLNLSIASTAYSHLYKDILLVNTQYNTSTTTASTEAQG